jgi:pimeloyl-ACP methyl ester carboxylesterase
MACLLLQNSAGLLTVSGKRVLALASGGAYTDSKGSISNSLIREVAMKMSVCQTSLGKVAVRDTEGAGGAVLLIHGNSLSSESYEHQLNGELGKRWRLVTFDLPGHGDSPPAGEPARTYSLTGYSRITREVASSLGLRKPVVVGHSLGGHIALQAVASGFEVSGIMVFGTPPIRTLADFPAAFHLDRIGGVNFRAKPTDTEILHYVQLFMPEGIVPPPYYLRSFAATDPAAREAFWSSLDGAVLANEQAVLESIRFAAILQGEFDRLVSTDYIRQLGLPNLWRGSVQLLPAAGHCPQYDCPDTFNGFLTEFLLAVTS